MSDNNQWELYEASEEADRVIAMLDWIIGMKDGENILNDEHRQVCESVKKYNRISSTDIKIANPDAPGPNPFPSRVIEVIDFEEGFGLQILVFGEKPSIMTGSLAMVRFMKYDDIAGWYESADQLLFYITPSGSGSKLKNFLYRIPGMIFGDNRLGERCIESEILKNFTIW